MARSIVLPVVVAGLISLGLSAPARGVIVEGDLVSYWKLDGDLNDSIGASHGTLNTGTATYVTGANGSGSGAIDLRGGTQFVQTGLQLDNTAKTLSLWVRSDLTNAGESVWAGNAATTSQRFYIGRRTTTAMWIGGGTTLSQFNHPNPFDDTYHHFALVWDGTDTLTAYQNGNVTPIHSAVVSGSTATTTQFLIGAAGGGNSVPALAILDDVGIFNRVLTVAEIQSIHAAGSIQDALFVATTPVPEPASLTLISLSLLGLIKRRTNRNIVSRN